MSMADRATRRTKARQDMRAGVVRTRIAVRKVGQKTSAEGDVTSQGTAISSAEPPITPAHGAQDGEGLRLCAEGVPVRRERTIQMQAHEQD